MSDNGALNISSQDVEGNGRMGIPKNNDKCVLQTIEVCNRNNDSSSSALDINTQHGVIQEGQLQTNESVGKLLRTDEFSDPNPSNGIANNLGVEFQIVEDWLKNRSDSLSSLDFDSEIKNVESDMYDLLNVKGFNINNAQEGSNCSKESSTTLLTNQFLKEYSEIAKSKKQDATLQLNKGLFEELLLSVDRDNKEKLSNIMGLIAEDRGLFEEELLSDVLNPDKKDLSLLGNLSVMPDPQVVSLSLLDQDLPNMNKETSDQFDFIWRNNQPMKLMTPQEIESMPTRSLGFDETPVKIEMDKKESESIFSFPAFTSREEISRTTEMLGRPISEVDSKITSLLAMEASNDNLDNNSRIIDPVPRPFISDKLNETILNQNKLIKLEPKESSTDNSNFLMPKTISSKNIENKQSNTNITPEYSFVLSSNVENKNLNSTKIPQSSKNIFTIQGSQFLQIPHKSNILKLKLNTGNNIVTTNANDLLNKASTYSENRITSNNNGILQLRLTSCQAPAKPQSSVLLKPVHKNLMQTNNLNGKKPTIISNNRKIKLFTTVPTNKIVSNATPIVNTVSTPPGNAKMNIKVDRKANVTTVSIVSSNNETTVFKINTCDLVKAVSSIRESHLDPLGLTPQHLLQSASTSQQLINHLIQQSIDKNKETSKNIVGPQNFEINQVVPEFKAPKANRIAFSSSSTLVSPVPLSTVPVDILQASVAPSAPESISTLSPVGFHISPLKLENLANEKNKINENDNLAASLRSGALPTLVSVPSVLDDLSISSASLFEDSPSSSNSSTNYLANDIDQVSDEMADKALEDLGINVDSLVPEQRAQGGRKWMCPIASCNKQFPKIILLKIHLLIHNGIKPYKCTYEKCDWSFYTLYKLKRHLESHLKKRDYVCTEVDCNKKFTTIYNLKTHVRLHWRPKTWTCILSECKAAFSTRKELEAHMKVHKDVPAPYKCEFKGCDKSYFTSTSLISHTRSHNTVELKCDWTGCQKTFDKPCRLKAHMRVHTGYRPFVCNFSGCNWSFQSASKLSRHQRKHTNDRKFVCPICQKSFLRSEHLKGHLLIHTGKRNFECPVESCNAKFAAKSSLYVHLKKHGGRSKEAGKVSFHCPVESCNKSYNSKFNLRQHMLKNHTPILASDSNQLDYITLLGEKDILTEQPMLLSPRITTTTANTLDSISTTSSTLCSSNQSSAVFLPAIELAGGLSEGNHVNNLPALIVMGNQNTTNTIDNNILDIPLLSPSVMGVSSSSNTVTQLLDIANLVTQKNVNLADPTLLEGNPGTTDVMADLSGNVVSNLPVLNIADLVSPKTIDLSDGSVQLNVSDPTLLDSGSARTDVMGNSLRSQRAKKRQQLNLAKKMAGLVSGSDPHINFSSDVVLTSSAEPLTSSHLQSSLLQDDAITNDLYQETLLDHDLLSDTSPHVQSTINLRDLE